MPGIFQRLAANGTTPTHSPSQSSENLMPALFPHLQQNMPPNVGSSMHPSMMNAQNFSMKHTTPPPPFVATPADMQRQFHGQPQFPNGPFPPVQVLPPYYQPNNLPLFPRQQPTPPPLHNQGNIFLQHSQPQPQSGFGSTPFPPPSQPPMPAPSPVLPMNITSSLTRSPTPTRNLQPTPPIPTSHTSPVPTSQTPPVVQHTPNTLGETQLHQNSPSPFRDPLRNRSEFPIFHLLMMIDQMEKWLELE